MKRLLTITKKLMIFVCLFVAAIAVSGCGKNKDDNKKPVTPDNVKITMTADKDTLEYGDEVTLTVTVTGTKNTEYTIKVTEKGEEVDYVTVDKNVLKVVKEVSVDKFITVTATSVADDFKSVTKTFTIKAPIISGQVGELTSDLIQEIAGNNITFTGVVTDIYEDLNNKRNNRTTEYEMTVMMEEGKWSGSFNPKEAPNAVISDTYLKGEKDGVKGPTYYDENGTTQLQVGHAVEYEYVNKNNQVVRERVKDYASVPTIWEYQHLWNHLGQINVNNFIYDAENEVYKYDYKTIEDAYLFTYLAISLTPMLGTSETLVNFWFKVEDNHISQILAQTVTLYDGSVDVDPKDASYLEYTTVTLNISNIDKTSIPSAKEYEAPENADKLTAALTYMNSIKNYTFQAVDITTQAPSTDSSDYEIESVSNTAKKSLSNKRSIGLKNYTASAGTVGTYGRITEDAAVFEVTTKYEQTMDGKDYKIEYNGYKKTNDETYDYFEFNSTKSVELDATVFQGKQKFYGSLFDKMPKFDFSANIFKFVSSRSTNSTTYYTFELREEKITRDIALAVSAYNYAENGERDNRQKTTITVDSEGHVVETVYPYNINSTYYGYVTTTYGQFETTTLDDEYYGGCFDNYVERVIRDDWSQFDVMYYHPTHSTNYTEQATADVVFKKYLGDNYKNLPSPYLFFTIFGDTVSGPFYDDDNRGTDEEPEWIEWLGITVKTDRCDENKQISEETFLDIKEQLDEKLGAIGYTLNKNNTDISGGATGRSDYYLCYTNGNIQIVINNNHSRYFWIDFYTLGTWSLKK